MVTLPYATNRPGGLKCKSAIFVVSYNRFCSMIMETLIRSMRIIIEKSVDVECLAFINFHLIRE